MSMTFMYMFHLITILFLVPLIYLICESLKLCWFLAVDINSYLCSCSYSNDICIRIEEGELDMIIESFEGDSDFDEEDSNRMWLLAVGCWLLVGLSRERC